MRDHERARLLAAAAIDEPLAPNDAAALEAHLRACTTCRGDALAFSTDAQRLGSLDPRPTSPWVREAVLASVRDGASGRSFGANSARAQVFDLRRHPFRTVVVLAVLVLATL